MAPSFSSQISVLCHFYERSFLLLCHFHERINDSSLHFHEGIRVSARREEAKVGGGHGRGRGVMSSRAEALDQGKWAEIYECQRACFMVQIESIHIQKIIIPRNGWNRKDIHRVNT